MNKPTNYRQILTIQTAKNDKALALGYLQGIIFLSPHTSSGEWNTCAAASPGCSKACLAQFAGRMRFSAAIKARQQRTQLWYRDRKMFLASLDWDIRALERKAVRMGLTPCIRPNGGSDLPKLAGAVLDRFGGPVFDYTKLPRSWERVKPNYHLTFSASEINATDRIEAINHGLNLAVVEREEPKGWDGIVVNGDEHDLRFLDPPDSLVWLKPKGGIAKRDTTGFVRLAV